ncbi:MAG: inorganic phosphate transporter [Cytophagales bacterium]
MLEAFQSLDLPVAILLVIALLFAFGFEFVNGFHDTANAVATVIYTNSLKPIHAVVWSGIWNFIGVFIGGISVAMSIVNLLPVETLIDQNVYNSVGMVLALLLTAIFWNLGTWWLGIPCSSSHTMIASILGVGVAYSFLPDATGVAVQWNKASEVGLSLLLSPVAGFGVTILFMYLLRILTKNEKLFKQPEKDAPPPLWIRAVLIFTCTGVSVSHGSNDGQKGVGLVMLILIGILPTYFALDNSQKPEKFRESIEVMQSYTSRVDISRLSYSDSVRFDALNQNLASLKTIFANNDNLKEIKDKDRFEVRKQILLLNKKIKDLVVYNEESAHVFTSDEMKLIQGELKNMRKFTDYAPTWVLVCVALSLGIGTMVGWKRIVTTIGEKIGKEHLTYAQGASAEMAAAATIAFSTFVMKLPVSTTQVLSSGIAGSMVANKGTKNLQPATLKSIAIAWLLTFPVCLVMSGSLFLFFRWLF